MAGKRLHRHHIIPRYMGGGDEEENIILVSKDHHMLIHWWYYRMWGNREDLSAVCLLASLTDELERTTRLMGAEATRRLWAEGGDWVLKRKEQLKRATAESHLAREKLRKENQKYMATLKERMSKMGKRGGEKGGPIGGAITGKQRWQCTVTGRILPPGPLSIYQRNRGIDTSNRIKLP